MRLSILIMAIAIICIGSRSVHADDPPYIVELNEFKVLTDYDESWIGWGSLRMSKVARNRFGITGDVEVNRNLGNEQKISIDVYKYDSERKQRGPLVFELSKPICKFIEEDDTTYPGMTEKSNLPKEPDCPFPQGTYTFDNYEVETTFLPDDTPKGDYLISVIFKDGERGVAGAEVDVTLS